MFTLELSEVTTDIADIEGAEIKDFTNEYVFGPYSFVKSTNPVSILKSPEASSTSRFSSLEYGYIFINRLRSLFFKVTVATFRPEANYAIAVEMQGLQAQIFRPLSK